MRLEPPTQVRVGSSPSCTIQLDGLGIKPQMCSIVIHDGKRVELVAISEKLAGMTAPGMASMSSSGPQRLTGVEHRRGGLTRSVWSSVDARCGGLGFALVTCSVSPVVLAFLTCCAFVVPLRGGVPDKAVWHSCVVFFPRGTVV